MNRTEPDGRPCLQRARLRRAWRASNCGRARPQEAGRTGAALCPAGMRARKKRDRKGGLLERRARLEREAAVAEVEKVLQRRAQQVEHHDVVVALNPKPPHVGDSGCICWNKRRGRPAGAATTLGGQGRAKGPRVSSPPAADSPGAARRHGALARRADRRRRGRALAREGRGGEERKHPQERAPERSPRPPAAHALPPCRIL